MKQETFIVGGREYRCVMMNPFAANRLLLRLQKIVIPLLGKLAGGTHAGSQKSLLDMDVAAAALMLSEHLDEALLDSIVLPMLAEAKVYSIEKQRFISDATAIDVVFSTETLLDFYELVWLVGRFTFSPFFSALKSRFGAVLGDLAVTSGLENSAKT